MAKTAETVVIDSGFWMALCDPRDPYHNQAAGKADYLDMLHVLCPWPTLYETLSTRFLKNPIALQRYDRFMKRPDVELIDDSVYRDDALEQIPVLARSQRRHIALVDMVIRSLLADINVRSNYLLTFNPADFADICRKRRIEML